MKDSLRACFRKEVLEIGAYEVENPPGLIKLDANESPYSPPREIMAEIADRAGAMELNRYPDPSAGDLREMLARRLGWDAGGIMLGNGSDELIGIICTACGGPGRRLLVPSPTFAMYRLIGMASGWRVDEAPLDDSFDFPEGSLLSRVGEVDPDLVAVAWPNNPTGNCVRRSELEECVRKAPGFVIVDEAYFDYSGKTLLPLLADNPNLILLRTLSKIGLAALRLGILAAHPDVVAEFNKVRLPYNVNSFSQMAALTALRNDSYLQGERESIISERHRLFEALDGMAGLRAYRSDSNFILFRTEGDSAEVFAGLKERGVLVRDLGGPGPLHNCLRVTVGRPEENDAFLTALAPCLEGSS